MVQYSKSTPTVGVIIEKRLSLQININQGCFPTAESPITITFKSVCTFIKW